MKPIHITFFGVIFLLAVSSKTYACSCVAIKLEQSIKSTEVILVGRFIQGEQLSEISADRKTNPMFYYTGKFIVQKVLKGKTIKVGDTLKVTTDHDNCSYLYQNETDYLFFSENGKVQTNSCTYTRVLGNENGRKIYTQVKRLLRRPELRSAL